MLIAQCSPLESVVNSKEVHTGACRLSLGSRAIPHHVLCKCALAEGRDSAPQQTGFWGRPDLSTKSSSFLFLKCTVFSPNFLLCSSTSSCPHSNHGLEAYSGAHKQQVISPARGQRLGLHCSRRLRFIRCCFFSYSFDVLCSGK